MIADLAVSGIGFRRYDKSNEVLVYGFVYGYKYWVQPNPSSNDMFRYFIAAIAEKDTSLLWSYIGYSNGFYRKLERQPLSDGQTQQKLLKLLSVMKKYRAIALTHFAATMVLTPISFALLFKYFHSTIFGMQFVDVLMPLMFLLWVSLGTNVFVSMRKVKKAGAQAMATIDSTKLSTQ